MIKRLIAASILAILVGCQTPSRYANRVPPPPPPPYPAGLQPYADGAQSQPRQMHPQSTPEHERTPVRDYGGSAGPLAAKNVGAYMDGLEHDLRHYLRGIPVARPGDVVVLNVKSDDMFEKGRLSNDGRDLLRNLSSALRHYDRTQVQVNGYTDTRSTPEQAATLTQKRADAVAAELRDQGIAALRLTATGYGSAHLRIATGDGKAEVRNRRIEIRIVPKPG
ncbi:MAG: OmpA family protein [Rhizomicrobium sp.]